MKYLAIDYGGKRTGVAMCDALEIVVSPYKILPSDAQLIDALVKIIKEEQIQEIVIGLPYNMDGSEGPQAKKVRTFAQELEKVTAVKINFQDERLSSFAAKDMLSPAELGWRKRKKVLDAVAAANILQSFLESKTL